MRILFIILSILWYFSVSSDNDIIDYDQTNGDTLGVFGVSTFTYSSSIDNINNLYCRYAFDSGIYNAPICVLMHGFNGNASDFQQGVMQRYASYKLFILVPGMRERNSAGGDADVSGRELYDIFDAIEYAKDSFPDRIDSTKISLIGFSGGGGNAYGVANKFPDKFSVITSCFGISDYGYKHSGWYYNNAGGENGVLDLLGYSPADSIELFDARYHVRGINNFKKGIFYIFHDDQDASVPISHTNKIDSAQQIADYNLSITTTTDDPRWIHGYPLTTEAGINHIEPIIKNDLLTRKIRNIANVDSIVVTGYVITSLFEIWLNDGTNASCSVNYDVRSKTYIFHNYTNYPFNVLLIQGTDTFNNNIYSDTTIIL